MRVNGVHVAVGTTRFADPSPAFRNAADHEGARSIDQVRRDIERRAQAIVDGFRFAIATASGHVEVQRVTDDYREACALLEIEPVLIGWRPPNGSAAG